MKLTRLRVNHQEKACVDQAPYFSWVITSDKNNVMQTSYHITVTGPDGVLWDSGIVESDASTFVEYGGETLPSLSDITWTVEAWDNTGEMATAASTFETGFIKRPWEAIWIRSPFPYKAGRGKGAPAEYFRRTFTVKANLKRARVYATCHGAYELTINGGRPDDRVLAPEFTPYTKLLCYQSYDILPLLREGENIIGMLVGDGWYNCKDFRPDIKKFQPEHAVLFQIRLDYADGSSESILSDDQVLVQKSPVQSSDLFAGEVYDARLERNGWDCPGFDTRDWRKGVPLGRYYGNLEAQYGTPVRPILERRVVKLTRSPKGETILDFGQNMAGILRVRTKLPAGAKLVLDHFETPDQHGNYFDNILLSKLTGHRQQDIYISDGRPAVFVPHFTYHGFRYVRVTSPEEIRPEDFTALVLSTAQEELGTFAASRSDIQRLYENTLWSQRSNMLSIPTDCPQREKAGWCGDIQIYAATSMLNANTTPLLTRWLRSLRCDQHTNGAVPMVVPYVGSYPKQGKIHQLLYHSDGPLGQAGWGDAACIVPWRMYEITGNTHILWEQYASMKKWCDYVISTAEKCRGKQKLSETFDRYLWNTGFQFGEWLIPSQSGKSSGPKIDSATYCAPIFGWRSCCILADTAALLGYGEDARYYREIAAKMEAAIRQAVIGADGAALPDLMGAYVLVIAFDLAEGTLREKLAQKLLCKIEENGGCLDTGFLATPYLLDALCKIGRVDKAYAILLQEKCPSWLYEVNQGATTIWESYISYQPDGTPLATSLNHYAFGCVDEWMFRKLCGIDKAAPGFKKIVIAPEYTKEFSHAERTYISEYGRIAVKWYTTDGQFQIDVEIPCNTTAAIRLPDGQIHEVGSGKYRFECSITLREKKT